MADALHDLARVLVVADDPHAADTARAAAALAGARVLGTVGWSDAGERLAGLAAPATLLIEAAGCDARTIARVLPELMEAAGAQHLVVAFCDEHLEQIGAMLIGSEAAILCNASGTDRAAALIMAQGTGGAEVSDTREEAARLARINAEVARFTETLAQLTGLPQAQAAARERSAIVGDRNLEFGQPDPVAAIGAEDLRRAIRARRMRDEIFGVSGFFENPAWDMLLDLFAAHLERREVSVSSLCIAAAVAPTTALRWINKLIAVGLFERRPDEFDRRRAYIALTGRAVTALHDYTVALRRGGLAIA